MRKNNTETQTHKNRAERWENIEGKFELINKQKAEGKHVLLVDDVLTTGATLEACGSELLKARGSKTKYCYPGIYILMMKNLLTLLIILCIISCKKDSFISFSRCCTEFI